MLRQVLLVASVIAALAVGDAAAPQAAPHLQAVSLCRTVRVSGGDFNGLTGGVMEAELKVQNAGRTPCVVTGRPWLRLPRLARPITVADMVGGSFAGTLSGRVLLKPGARARALIWLEPGSCGRGAAVTFDLTARAGWGKKSVPIGSNEMCNDGTATIDLGRFRPA